MITMAENRQGQADRGCKYDINTRAVARAFFRNGDGPFIRGQILFTLLRNKGTDNDRGYYDRRRYPDITLNNSYGGTDRDENKDDECFQYPGNSL